MWSERGNWGTLMRIAIDVHMVGERETGNETYTLNLVRHLLELDTSHRFGLLTPHPERLLERLSLPPHAEVLSVTPAQSLLRVPLGLPLRAWRWGADVLHVNYVAPPFCPCPVVVTVHDISYEFFPQFFSPRDRRMLGAMVPFSARRAAAVISVSERTREDLMRVYGIPRERIAVTLEAAAPGFAPVTEPAVLEDVCARYGIRRPYILALGNLQPRKNIQRLVEAFDLARRQCRLPHQLVVAGKAQWRESEVYHTIRERGLQDEVGLPGYVADADLPALYSAADCFAYPSIYEGFGLPPLEAMACGTPVLSSQAGALGEVVGDAAVVVDPTDVPSIAQGLTRLLTDRGVADDYRRRGLERAAMFSWARLAQETLEVYGRVARKAG
ncbi:MAG: glycosyltransferase family 4 protein [Chloroflexi bacterium]|nr:glycosyltransferase family 4 protein [Chloroflexota bacterium]